MNAKHIRQKFLDYFKSHHHEIVASSSLIPAEDPTLLFTNAGMNQFKDIFLDKETRRYTRATSAQKCVRAGGKHNDLEQVGFTARHLTFFEMLGNFSFGDYFKKEAIEYAWELLTKEYKLDPQRLYASVYLDDDEAYTLWHEHIGLPKERIVRLDEKDNFWAMGDTGPCGPCSEIYYDKDPSMGAGLPGDEEFDERFLEVWNLVFMQFNRSANGSLTPLKKPGIDTGMGFERLVCVLQNKDNVYATDIFDTLRSFLNTETGKNYWEEPAAIQVAYNVLFDHVRSCSLLIADGCSPSNDGRGYVLRKIIRRAILFAQKLSDDNTLFPRLAQAFITDMSDVFTNLATNASLITSVLQQEVDRFVVNLAHGQTILQKYLQENSKRGITHITGHQAFKLYDTYGFPLELTKVIAHDHSITVDEDGFSQEMTLQQEQSKQKKAAVSSDVVFPDTIVTKFVGYTTTQTQSRILWEHTGEKYRWIITEESPFYVESGGQVNDEGVVTINNHSYHVVDLKKVGAQFQPAIAIKLTPVETMGSCVVGDVAMCEVSKQARIDTVRNHTATHMLHAALQEILGPQAKQAGSVVNKEYLRFDYTHHEPLSEQMILEIENRVNSKIWEDIQTEITQTTLEDAKKRGAMAFFGEKYNPESVRVVSIPGFSTELCGGTHAPSTGILGCFKVVSDTALATGTRRMVAVTGPEALKLFQRNYHDAKTLGEQFKVKVHEIVGAVAKQTEELLATQKEVKKLRKKLLKHQLVKYTQNIITDRSLAYSTVILSDSDMESMRAIAHALLQKKPGFYLVINNDTVQNKSQFIAVTHPEVLPALAHKMVAETLQKYNLRGGGKPGQIQGGGVLLDEKTVQEIINSLIK